MQVGKPGDSLAVRLPAAVVEVSGLKEGDEIEVAGDRTREEAFARLRAPAWKPPPGSKFSREEANERGGKDE